MLASVRYIVLMALMRSLSDALQPHHCAYFCELHSISNNTATSVSTPEIDRLVVTGSLAIHQYLFTPAVVFFRFLLLLGRKSAISFATLKFFFKTD